MAIIRDLIKSILGVRRWAGVHSNAVIGVKCISLVCINAIWLSCDLISIFLSFQVEEIFIGLRTTYKSILVLVNIRMVSRNVILPINLYSQSLIFALNLFSKVDLHNYLHALKIFIVELSIFMGIDKSNIFSLTW